jgi:hypothetical protein
MPSRVTAAATADARVIPVRKASSVAVRRNSLWASGRWGDTGRGDDGLGHHSLQVRRDLGCGEPVVERVGVGLSEDRALDGDTEGGADLTSCVVERGAESGVLGRHRSHDHAAGFSCLPIEESVRDTWAWMSTGDPAVVHPRHDEHGIEPMKEHQVLNTWRRQNESQRPSRSQAGEP